jgi:hypothetical protein
VPVEVVVTPLTETRRALACADEFDIWWDDPEDASPVPDCCVPVLVVPMPEEA